MSLPTLDLQKNHCTRYFLEYNFFLEQKTAKTPIEAEFVADRKTARDLLVVHNYGQKGKECSVIYSSQQHECKRDKKKGTSFGFRLEYNDCHVGSENIEHVELAYTEFLKHLWSVSVDVRGRILAYFEFPRKKFESLINLPYYREDLAIDKKIKISGLDLRIESEREAYNQFVRVSDNQIYQTVGFLHLDQKPTQSFLRDKLKDASLYAQELLRTAKGKANAKSDQAH